MHFKSGSMKVEGLPLAFRPREDSLGEEKEKGDNRPALRDRECTG